MNNQRPLYHVKATISVTTSFTEYFFVEQFIVDCLDVRYIAVKDDMSIYGIDIKEVPNEAQAYMLDSMINVSESLVFIEGVPYYDVYDVDLGQLNDDDIERCAFEFDPQNAMFNISVLIK